jgi:flagellar hook-length control protein FliK
VTSVAFDLPFVSSRPDHASRPNGTGGDGGFAALVDDTGTEPKAPAPVHGRSEDQPKPAETQPAASASGRVTEAAESRPTGPASSGSAPATGEIAATSSAAVFALVSAAPELQAASGSAAQVPQPNAAMSAQTPAQPGTGAAILNDVALVEAAADGTDSETPDNADAGIVTGPQVMSEAVPATAAIASLVTPTAAPNEAPADASVTAPAQAAPDIAPAAPETIPAETVRPGSGMANAMSAAAAAGTPSATSPVPTTEESVASAAQSSNPEPAKPAELAPASTGQAEQQSKSAAHAKAMQASTQATPAHPQTESSAADPQQTLTAGLDQSATLARPALDASLSNLLTPAPVDTTSLHATTHAATSQAASANATQTVPVEAIAVEIASQALAGKSRFEIRLDPPELGRIDVRLDIDRDGNVTSRLVIERSDTYDLLRRDQSTLERALQQAGLKTSDNALEFSLRDQGFAQQRDAEDRNGGNTRIHDADIAPSEAVNGYVRLLGLRGGIDIRV